MAGILMAQNESKIIGIIINDHEKYEGRVLEDGFISSAVNALSREIDSAGYFMMLKLTKQ
jgi:LacI family transcriptional regulator